MQAGGRTDIRATIVLALALAPAGLAGQAAPAQETPGPSPTPSLLDPRRPPAREL